MTDILGPGSTAANVTTSRPADDRVMGDDDTWLQNCSSPTANDGTILSAEFLNKLIAELREFSRGNGSLAGGGKVVVEDNSDSMLLRSVQHLIQRGLVHRATDTGAANALVASMVPPPPEIVDGMLVVMRPAAANTGATTLKVAGLVYPAVTSGGAPLSGGELATSLMTAFRFNASINKWQVFGSTPDTALVHYGVDTSGSTNTIVAAVKPGITEYKAGHLFAIEPATTNTGLAKANFSALGLKNIVNNNSGELLSKGELSEVGNFIALMLYGSDGRLHLLNPLPRGVSRAVTFAASGNFVAQESLVCAIAWGGGAAGRNVTYSGYGAGRGGGPGEFRFGFFQVSPGSTTPVTIGAGAAAGSNGNGGATSFGSFLTAYGGVSFNAGSGGLGGVGLVGEDGQPGYSNGNVPNAVIITGRGGRPALGGIYGAAGNGGDGGPSGNPSGLAGLPGYMIVMGMS